MANETSHCNVSLIMMMMMMMMMIIIIIIIITLDSVYGAVI